jgi:phage tail-like protein
MAERSFAAGRFAFGIDGEFAGFIKKVSGGTIKGEVVTHNLGTSNIQKKHLATISHEPLDIEISMGMGQNMWAWIKSSFDNGFVQKNCELQACNFNNQVMAVRSFSDAYISEVTIPALDGSNKDAGYFTIKLDPRIIRYEKGGGEIEQGKEEVSSKKWLCSNFSWDIDGLPCSRIAKTDSIKWTQKIVKDEVGAFREPTKEPAALECSNIKLTISMADIEKWAEWHRSFVIDGKCTDGDEKTGTLTLLGPDLKEDLMVLNFEHLGIISLEQEAVEANKEEVARFTVELYCEKITIIDYK